MRAWKRIAQSARGDVSERETGEPLNKCPSPRGSKLFRAYNNRVRGERDAPLSGRLEIGIDYVR